MAIYDQNLEKVAILFVCSLNYNSLPCLFSFNHNSLPRLLSFIHNSLPRLLSLNHNSLRCNQSVLGTLVEIIRTEENHARAKRIVYFVILKPHLNEPKYPQHSLSLGMY